VVVPVDNALVRGTADDVAEQLERLPSNTSVIVDLTGIASFDSDGAAALLDLQDAVGHDRMSIVGFRQAAARLIGSDVDVTATGAATTVEAAVERGWVVRRLRNLAVVQPADGDIVSTDDLEPMLTSALAEDVAIVVVDLRNTTGLTPAGLHALTFASSSAALRGQELLVVNVGPEAAEALRHSGLSATTFVAPEPLA
jgi:anti-anti-sigma regulatory factor